MSKEVTVIDIGIGNLSSVLKAIKKAGATAIVASDAESIYTASKLIFPGVGSFGAGSEALQTLGLIEPIREVVLNKKVPIFGFCMGMQLFAERGFENGDFRGLGLISAEVRKLDIVKCKVLPHMGWNNLESLENMQLFEGLSSSLDFYFVHSYHMVGMPQEVIASYCAYGSELITAAIQLDNIHGAQFHPEKSLANGIHVLKNFIENA